MMLLGRTADDKGKQLEGLTRIILEELGYSDVSTNVIAGGGEEIDVSAVLKTTGLESGERQKIICECKAYSDKIDINDWLKFLGKAYTQEKTEIDYRKAYMVALNGANGNVIGHYENLRKKTSSISLVTGGELTDICRKYARLAQEKRLGESVSSFSDRRPERTDLLFYANKFYWCVVFEKEEFTLLLPDATPLSMNKESRAIIKLTATYLGNSSKRYIDLIEEKKNLQSEHAAMQFVVAELFTAGRIKLDQISAPMARHKSKVIAQLSQDEIAHLEDGLLVAGNKMNTPEGAIKCLQYMTRSPCDARVFTTFFNSERFSGALNESMIAHIAGIQGGLRFGTEEVDKIIQVMKMSPRACVYAMTPDLLITNHRREPVVQEVLDQFDRTHFINKIYGALSADFSTDAMKNMFFSKNIVEMETITEVIVKSGTGVLLQDRRKERIGLGKTAPEYGGGVIQILLVNSAPEPWEIQKPPGSGAESVQ